MGSGEVRKGRVGIGSAFLGMAVALASSMTSVTCSHTYALMPSSTATVTSSAVGPAAEAENNAVRMVVSTQAWAGDPPNLTKFVLPVWVNLENHSGQTIWVHYSDFQIVAGTNQPVTLHVIPPFKVKGTAVMTTWPVYQPPSGWVGFAPAPYVGPIYKGVAPWVGDYPMDRGYYMTYGPYWTEALPTDDMLVKAMPEGALNDGGRVSGFLYFERLEAQVADAVLRATFRDAAKNQPFARVEIDYRVTKI